MCLKEPLVKRCPHDKTSWYALNKHLHSLNLLDDALRLGLVGAGGGTWPSPANSWDELPRRQLGPPPWSGLPEKDK